MKAKNLQEILDSTDPVELLMKVQLGGGTDIAKAVAYGAGLVDSPRRSIVVVISDFYEGGSESQLVRTVKDLCEQGTHVLCLAALDDDDTTSSEELAALVPGARVVKAFNTLFWEHLRDRGGETDRIALFVAGDDVDAKATVSALIEDIGFAPVDVGDLAGGGRKLQPGGPLSGALVPESEAAARV